MLRISLALLGGVILLNGLLVFAQNGKMKTTKEALLPFNEIIGEWKGTGIPKGSKAEIQKGFWVEKQDWAWRFKGEDAWLIVHIDKGKYFKKGELRYLPDKGQYQFTAETKDKQTQVFTGTLEDRWLIMEREDKDKKEKQRVTIRLLHPNRFLFHYDVLAEGKAAFARVYEVGVTKQGVEFASGDGRPECIVTGGLGTSTVTYQGKTYYVCCSGCRDAFNENPQRYIDAAAKKKEKK